MKKPKYTRSILRDKKALKSTKIDQLHKGVNRKLAKHPLIQRFEKITVSAPNDPLTILKVTCVPFSPKTPKHTMWNNLPSHNTPMLPYINRPSCEEIEHTVRHNPLHPKQTEHHRLQLLDPRAM